MKIGYDAKRYYHNYTGLGNYSRTLVGNMQQFCPDVAPVLYDSAAMERTFSLCRKATQDGCELFHGLSNELPRDILKAGIPTIVTMHDVAWRTFPDMYTWIDRHIYDWKYGFSAKNASHVVCISESTKRDVMRFYRVPEERISVIYQPVRSLFYTPIAKDSSRQRVDEIVGGRPYILTVGSINSRKNLLNQVKALSNIPEKERPLFVVVGNGRAYRKKVEQYIAENSLSSWIRIFDNINDGETLQALYSEAICLLYPSFYEGFGLPVVEAALQHCPVITSNISSLPEAAGPDALLVDPNSVEQITEALSLLLTNEEERQKRADSGYQYCMEHFQPEHLTTQLFSLYKNLTK